MRILLDTSVVLRLLEPHTAAWQEVLDALDQLGKQGMTCCLVPQVIYELWVVATRPVAQNGLGFSAEQATQEVAQLTSLFTLLKDERSIYEQWQQLVTKYQVQGKNAHDTRIVAAMLRHGISHLLTRNAKDFQRYAGITVYTPTTVPTPLPDA